MDLFRRTATIQIDEQRIVSKVEDGKLTGVDVRFLIERTTKPSPNKVEVSLWNLSRDTRQKLTQLRDVFVSVSAGYGGEEHLLFAGDLVDVRVSREGADVVTTVSGGDGKKAIQTGRVSLSFPKNTSALDVAKQLGSKLVEQLKGAGKELLTSGNVDLGGISRKFANGFAAHGNTANELERVLDSVGYEYSIQNNELRIRKKGEARNAQFPTVLNHDTGLLSAPERSSDGIVQAQCLLIPGIEPGDAVEFRPKDDALGGNNDSVAGLYRVEKAVYQGSSFEQNYYIDLEAKELQNA